MTVYDSLLSFTSYSYPEHFLYLFNTNSQLIGKYANKGRGPDDFQSFGHSEQLFLENGDIKLWVEDNSHNIGYKLFNLTKSIHSSKMVIDSIVNINWKKLKTGPYRRTVPYSRVFMVDNGEIFGRLQAESIIIDQNTLQKEYHPDKYEVLNSQGEILREITLYKEVITRDDFAIPQILISNDRVKPDKSKIAMGMEMLAQLNIYDIKSDKLTGYRITGSPDYEDLKYGDRSTFRMYFRDVCVDDDYIYALYSDVEFDLGKNYPFESNTVLIYNWDGEIIKRVVLDKKTYEIAIDPTSDYLYVLTTDQLVYRYDVG